MVNSEVAIKKRNEFKIVDQFVFVEANRQNRCRLVYKNVPADNYLHILIGKCLASYQPLVLAEIVYDTPNSPALKQVFISSKVYCTQKAVKPS